MDESPLLDLTVPDHAYFFGFCQADGHLFQNKDKPNKGVLQVELGSQDRPLLEAFQKCY